MILTPFEFWFLGASVDIPEALSNDGFLCKNFSFLGYSV
jgi:hypothetical protein